MVMQVLGMVIGPKQRSRVEGKTETIERTACRILVYNMPQPLGSRFWI